MKKEKSFIIIGIFLFTIVNLYLLSQDNLVEKRTLKELILVGKEIQKEIEKEIKNGASTNYYYVEESAIYKMEHAKKTQIKKLDSFDGMGTILVKSGNIKDFQIQQAQYCIQLKKGNIFIIKKTCSVVGEKQKIATTIEATALDEELLKEDENTAYNSHLPFASKKYYGGKDPNNYLVFENSCYRILNIANNETIKIIYEGETNKLGNCYGVIKDNSGFVALLAWHSNKKEKITWKDSYLNYKLQRFAEEEEIDMVNVKVKLDKEKIEDATWYTGEVTRNSDTLKEVVFDERKLSTTEEMNMHRKTKLGLINVSDYLKISCKKGLKNQTDECGQENYLYKPAYDYWTISSINDRTNEAWQVTVSGDLGSLTIPYSREYSYSGIRPVMYIKASVTAIGTGTSYNPYQI